MHWHSHNDWIAAPNPSAIGLMMMIPINTDSPNVSGMALTYKALSDICDNENATEYCAMYMSLLPFVEIGAFGGEYIQLNTR
jgi:hypothetical protein